MIASRSVPAIRKKRHGSRSLVVLLCCGAIPLAGCQGNQVEEAGTFPDLSSVERIGEMPAAAGLNRGRSVVLVFAPEHCEAVLGVIDRFNALSRTGSGLPVRGVVYTPYRQAALKALDAYEIRFPVLYDSLGVASRALDVIDNPALFLLEDGEVVESAYLGRGDGASFRRILAAAGGR